MSHGLYNDFHLVWRLSQQSDKRIINMIHKLVGEGIRNIKEMQRALRLYVKMELFEGQRPPPINSRRFYPEELYIRNYMYNATAKLRISKVDQENFAIKIENWEKRFRRFVLLPCIW